MATRSFLYKVTADIKARSLRRKGFVVTVKRVKDKQTPWRVYSRRI